MNKFILLVNFLIAIIQLKAQSKKEQIQTLNLKIDSLFGVLQDQRSSNDKQFKYFENFISTLNNEKQKLKEQIKDLEAVVKFKDQKLSSIHFTLDSLTEINRKLIYFPKDTVILEIKPTPLCDIKPTKVVDVTNPITGKTWMDRNLGATRAATSPTDEAAYGYLYQWGRAADGHQCRNSSTTSSLSTTEQPNHPLFILSSTEDWCSPQNNNLWQPLNGVNNPCPIGYRIPTETELRTELKSWSEKNSTGAFKSPLKFTLAGTHLFLGGNVVEMGKHGYYWSSSANGASAWSLDFSTGHASMFNNYPRAYGFSVRCTKYEY